MTTQYVEDSRNFGRDEHFGRETRYEMAQANASTWCAASGTAGVKAPSYRNKATGQYLDASKVRRVEHKRRLLPGARAAQRRAVPARSADRVHGRDSPKPAGNLAAYGADALFGTASNLSEAKKAYADIKGRMAKYGRSPDQLKIGLHGGSVRVHPTEPYLYVSAR